MIKQKVFAIIIHIQKHLAKMLPDKKAYIDTKHQTKDNMSSNNFRYELPQTMFMPENIIFYVDDVAIPHSWTSVESFNVEL